ncbi:MAG: Do family serine endopeptidase [Flavobacteriales bacterium]
MKKVMIFIGILLTGFGGGTISFLLLKNNQQTVENQPIEGSQIQERSVSWAVNDNQNTAYKPEASLDFTVAAEKTVNAVVNVTTHYSNTYRQDPFLDFFWGPGGSRGNRPEKATGSGVIISDDGYIVTNNHVIDNADKIEVTLNNKQKFQAKLVGTDPSTDLALLKIESNNLPFINFSNSDEVRVGEWVLAVGNPFNLTSTVTAGIVSAKARSINLLQFNPEKDIIPMESFIQTDAAVNPGNSGGALVNAYGDLIGINTAIASRTGSYAGYSFAVPSNIVKKVTEDLLEFGFVQRAFLGVSIQDINQEKAEELGMKKPKGVLVVALSSDGAAALAGVKENDVILKVGSTEVNNVPELQEQVGRFRPGDKVTLTIKRNSKEEIVSLTLRNKNNETNLVKKEEISKYEALGAIFRRLNADELAQLKISHGIAIEKVNPGKLRSVGIKDGFIIQKINQEKINTPEEAIRMLNEAKGGVLIEGMYKNGMKQYFGFGI